MENIWYLLIKRKVWVVFIGFVVYGYLWFLFLIWFFGYLVIEMNMFILKLGWYLVILWIVGIIIEIVIGGWFVDCFINKGYNWMCVSKFFLVIGMVFGLLIIGVVFIYSVNVVVFWILIVFGGFVVIFVVVYSIFIFIVLKGMVGILMGFLIFGNNLMVIVVFIMIGFIV